MSHQLIFSTNIQTTNKMKILFFALALLSWQHVLVQGFEGSDLWNAFYAKSHAKRLKDLGNKLLF